MLASCVFSALLWSCQARNVNIKNWGGSPKLIFSHFFTHFSKSWLQMVAVPTWSYLYVVSPQRSKEFYEFMNLHPQGSLAKDEDWCVGVPTIGTPGIFELRSTQTEWNLEWNSSCFKGFLRGLSKTFCVNMCTYVYIYTYVTVYHLKYL